jgi:hypothetical protein
MAKIKAGKKIRSALKTFQQQKTKRVQAVAGAVSDIVASRQAGRTARAQARQAGKVGKAEAVAAGGGFIGRQEAIGVGFQTAGKLGTAAATGGASLLGDALGGFGSSGMTFDTGSGAVSAAPPPAPQPFYTKPVFLIGAGLAAFLLLRPRNGRR